VEVVNRESEIDFGGKLQLSLRNEIVRFLTSRLRGEVGGNGIVDKVFHVSAPPTVTAGFIAFVFDIRK
jgi:hypothetical protein